MAGRAAAELKRVTSPRSNILPTPLLFLSKLTPVFTIVAGVLDQLNGYALVYVGITGDAFWPSARRAVGLAGKRKGGHLLDCAFSSVRRKVLERLTNRRHAHQAALDSELNCHGPVHCDSRVSVHGTLALQSRVCTVGWPALWCGALPGYSSRSRCAWRRVS